MARFVATLLGLILAGLVFVADAHAADETRPACKTAEVNPVTGYVFCIDPLGAPVAPPPEADPCKHDRDDAEWTWGPGCTESKGS
jgi:hypothetical protein